MAFDEVVCHIPLCDRCGPEWQDETTIHFVQVNDATYRALEADYDWLVERRPDRQVRMLCPSCKSLDACDRLGHVWTPLEPTELHPLPADWCGRCFKVRRLDEPVADHPETMTRLSAPEEERLARINDELWGAS